MPTFTLTALTVQFGPTFETTPLDASSDGRVVITSRQGIPQAFFDNGPIDTGRARSDGTFIGDIESISIDGARVDPATLIASRVTVFYGDAGETATNMLTLFDPVSRIEALIYLQDDSLPLIDGGAAYQAFVDSIVQASFTDRGDYREDRPIFLDDLPGVVVSGVSIFPGASELGDRLFGTAADERFEGLGGDDIIGALAGDDLIRAGLGDDLLDGGEGADRMFGASGRDTLRGQAGEDTLDGGDGDDVLDGGNDRDEFYGGAGNDLIVGGAGNDQLRGGPGDDTIRGGDGARDRLFYQDALTGVNVNFATGVATDGEGGTDEFSGVERLTTSSHDDTIIGTEGDQYLTPDEGDDYVDGGAGDRDEVSYRNASGAVQVDLGAGLSAGADGQDTLVGVEALVGSTFDDLLTGASNNNYLNGFDGDDTIFGAAGDDTLEGNAGDDLLNGGPGSDRIIVDSTGDRVAESRRWAGDDTVVASVDFRMGTRHIENLELTGDAVLGAGNGLANRITGNASDNVLDGGKNVDTLVGGAGNDRYLIRAPGDNAVEVAGGGIDTVLAFRAHALDAHIENLYLQTLRNAAGQGVAGVNGIGNDLDNTIVGNPFDNVIAGREGNDTLRGQAGADTFVFDRAFGAGNVDTIVDFSAVEGDRLRIDQDLLPGVARGNLDADHFVVARFAQDANDRLVFDPGAGRLWYDADGAGGAGQVLVSTFAGRVDLTANDIDII